MSPRRTLVAANWKMNLRRGEAESYCRRLAAATLPGGVDVVVLPPFPLLPVVASGCAGTRLGWGGQDLHPDDAGAHTGDVSGPQLLDWGSSWALCGHSERRGEHGESDELVARKVAAAVRHGLQPMLCVGESETERSEARTEEVLARQLAVALPPSGSSWALAYEPIWAIGTGRTATPEIAQAAHAHLRALVAAERGDALAGALRILYGGSVKPDNCESLLAQPDIDGFLVGGASLDPDTFLDIIRRCDSSRDGSPEVPTA